MPIFSAFTSKGLGQLPSLVNEVHLKIANSIKELVSEKLGNQIIKIKALWDTGATRTVISTNLVKQLRLPPTGETTVSDANKTQIVHTYKIDLFLPNSVVIPDMTVAEARNLLGFDMLIGMDVINLGDFAISNANNKTCFSFRIPPDSIHIDFVEKHNLITKEIQRKTDKKKKRRNRKR